MFADRRAWRSPERDDRNFCQGYILQWSLEHNSALQSSRGCGVCSPTMGSCVTTEVLCKVSSLRLAALPLIYILDCHSPMNHLSILGYDYTI